MARPVEIRITGDASGGINAINRTERELRQLDRTASSANSGLGGLRSTLVKLGGALGGLAAARASFNVLKESIGLASDLTETVSKTDVVFGKSSAGIQKWAQGTSAALVMPQKDILDLVTGFDLLLGNKGITGSQGRQWSKRLTELSADLSSFFNVDPAQAADAITAALKGEMDPIEKFGVTLDDATLKAEAYALGLYSGKGALSANAKAQAAYNTILKQTKQAQGDLIRTQGSAANQMRQFTNNIEGLKTTLGTAFTPLIEKYLPGVNDWLRDINNEDAATDLGEKFLEWSDKADAAFKDIKSFARELKSSFSGIDLDSADLSSTLDGAASALGSIADGAGAVLRAFDELSPEAKANIGLIIAAGGAFTLAKRNPVVKIGVDLVGGVISAVGTQLATSLTALKFPQSMKIAGQPIRVTGIVSDGSDGRPGKKSGDTGLFGGKSLKGFGLTALASLLLPEIINRLPVTGALKEQIDGLVSIGTWAAMGAAFGGPPGAVIGGILKAVSLVGANYEGLSKEQAATQAQSDYLKNTYNQQVPPLQSDAKKAKGQISSLQGTSSYLQSQQAAQAADIRAVEARLSDHWDYINSLYARGMGYGQSNPSISGGSPFGRALGERAMIRYGGELAPKKREETQVNVYLDSRQIASYLQPAGSATEPRTRRP